MKITKKKLVKLINEEIRSVLNEYYDNLSRKNLLTDDHGNVLIIGWFDDEGNKVEQEEWIDWGDGNAGHGRRGIDFPSDTPFGGAAAYKLRHLGISPEDFADGGKYETPYKK